MDDKTVLAANDTPLESSIFLGKVFQERYKVVGLLGSGGFGKVYRVEDLRLPGKFWALKKLSFEDKSQLGEAKRKFEREVRFLATLIHRSLPVIVDYFTEGEISYMIMEEVEGSNLAEIVAEKGPVEEREAIGWALQIAKVLEYLHHQDPPVIFRDLKPENIMLSKDGCIKLIDFGLARFFDAKKDRDSASVGSVGYAAPEVWEEDVQSDTRADIYSLGACLYFLLTAKVPSPVCGSHKVEDFRSGLNKHLLSFIAKSMETKADDRYQSANEVIAELMSILNELAGDDSALKEDLKHESFYRAASQSVSKDNEVVALNTEIDTLKDKINSGRFSETPVWSRWVLWACTILFIVGAVGGYLQLNDLKNFELDRPYELINADKEIALDWIHKGDLSRAADYLDKALLRHPSDAEAHIWKENVNVMTSGHKFFRIPILAAFSGINAPEAYRLLYGISLAQKEFNRLGGDKYGRLVVIDIFDDRSNLEQAAKIAKDLVEDDDYSVIIGPFSSQFALSLSPYFNASKMPILTPVASSPELWKQGEYIFTVSDTNDRRCQIIADYLRDKGCKNVGVLVDQDSTLSSDMASYFKEEFIKKGGEVGADLVYVNVNFEKVVESLRQSKVDSIFFSDSRALPLLEFSRAAKARGLRVPIASHVAPFTKDLIANKNRDSEGILLSGYFYAGSKEAQVKEYVEEFKESFAKLPPSHLDASAYDVTKIILSAYKEGKYSRQEIRDYLASIHNWQGVTGRFSLAENLNARQVYLVKIHDGQYEVVETRSAAQ
ncbi:ABC transporter substrate-binding protein, partial [bacterium]|nr:ABC transporter substrate-binding protein [bacterium]